MTSRMTIRLQRSPSCSTVRLIGHSDRPVWGTATRRFRGCNILVVIVGVNHLRIASSRIRKAHHGASAIRPSLLLVHAKSAHRSVREQHALRVPLPWAGYAAALGRMAAPLAAAQVSAAGGRRAQHRRDQYYN